jgi:hypothetical protein
MIQRLFFDRVDLQRGWRSIPEVIELPVLIDADKAKSRLPGVNVAMPRAQEAMHAPAAFRLPPLRFVQGFRLLEDLQIAHDPPPAVSILPASSSGASVRHFQQNEITAIPNLVRSLNGVSNLLCLWARRSRTLRRKKRGFGMTDYRCFLCIAQA